MTSNFAFLHPEWPALQEAAAQAEKYALVDPRTACVHARRALELAVRWLYTHDKTLRLPYQDHLAALLHEPTFKQALGPAVLAKAGILKELGNLAVHSAKPVRAYDALTAVKELFHLCFWLARTYAKGTRPPDGLAFDQECLPKPGPAGLTSASLNQVQALEAKLREKDERLTSLLEGRKSLDDELARLREEVARAKQANATQPDTHDYSEAATRDYFIDLLLKEAGWALEDKRDREFEIEGMPNAKGVGYADYVLWGDDGLPLAVVEAKRTKRNPNEGKQQAKLYADGLERKYGRRPLIYYTNGYEHWFWDDTRYPPRPVQGFHTKAEMELMIQRRQSRRALGSMDVDASIVERHYQTRAIRRIGEAFEVDHERKALVVMATGAGKTRTVIALCDLLMRANWAKRILFLADRVALVNQAVKAFKRHLPSCPPVNLVTEKDTDGRICVCTYPSMMGLIEDKRDGLRRFGIGHFDLVVIDEAHRSVYQKYRAIFSYFDSLLVGLTATPRDEVDRDTYSLFDLERGVPTDSYELEDAVKDGFLVPPKAVSVPLKFQREGISYNELSDEEKEQWEALDWDEEEGMPEEVSAESVNKWLFNQDTVDKVLEHLMVNGIKVAGGDRLGKTIIFAKNHDHAEFISARFDIHYPHLKGHFARVIDFKTEYAQTLIDDFSLKDKAPHIAISVDMLDTGIDVPEVVNLVFFKIVRSKTKFWQMIGRGTRLCPDLFGPGVDKDHFLIFDYCQNFEFFNENPEAVDGALGESLAARLFKARLELIGCLEKKTEGRVAEGGGVSALVEETSLLLQREVAAMNVENFVVRPHRRWVEVFARPEAWSVANRTRIPDAVHLAGLPTELAPEDEEAKRFDLLILRLQLAVLNDEPSFTRLRDQVKAIAGLLEEMGTIPMVRAQMALILALQEDAWWENTTPVALEGVRKKLRGLVKLIERGKRKPVFTDFEDEIGSGQSVGLPGFTPPDSYARFQAKARLFLKAHENDLVLHRLRHNLPLTPTDLTELERMMLANGVGAREDIDKAKAECQGLGLFVRSLVGLDREAAKQVLAGFLAGKSLTANQIEFANLIIDHLTEHGSMDPGLLYESPFIDISPRGADGVFGPGEVSQLLVVLDGVRRRAVAEGGTSA